MTLSHRSGSQFCTTMIFLLCVILSGGGPALRAQVPSPWVDTKPLVVDTGDAGLKQMLRRLHTTARLMHTVAHPDDEDGGMLTLESRGHGDTVLQLTLNRGEGGQNRVGNNLFDELGIVRTLELLAADRYYGVDQRFTRVADFGFSKTAEETFQKWHGHDVALGDMVRVIRTFRPDVICTRFRGDDRDGHGHHQASGILSREAFRAAADPTRFPDQLREGLQPWQAKKLYMDNVRSTEDWTVELETSQTDPLLGETYIQFAWKGLKHQLSQGAGGWTLPEGRRTSYYKLIDSALPQGVVANAKEKDFFDGIDTSLPGLASRLGPDARNVPWLRTQLESIAKTVDEATTSVQTNDAAAAAPLLHGLSLTRALISKVAASQLSTIKKADLLANLKTKQEQFEQAANLALGLELSLGPGTPDGRPMAETLKTSNGDVLAAVITAGKPFLLLAKFQNNSSSALSLRQFLVNVPSGWKSELFMERVPKSIPAGEGCALTFRVSPPIEAHITKAYFHRDDPETDTIYKIDEPEYVTLPLPPPPVSVQVEYALNGEEGEMSSVARTPIHNTSNDAWSMPLAVVPPFSVDASPATQIIRSSADPSSELQVQVRSTLDTANGTVHPEVPAGWNVQPQSAPVSFSKAGERSSDFKVLPDGAKEARYQIRALLNSDGRDYSQQYSLVTRPDIGGFFYFQPALQRASIVEVQVPQGLRIGYLMGAGDDIPEVLRELGLDVTMLTSDDLAHDDLKRFGTIVLGIRAYDTDDELKKHNQRLFEYVHDGGTLIVQYNTSPADFNSGKFTPYPAQLSRERVTVEQAPVTILDPQNPVFHYPNQITERDFDGWVQERGLYFMDQWDEHYVPLLASNDPGQQPQKGGMLLARYGRGYYVYTGYAFFRQLPFGVAGAIRLYVNLLSVGHEPR